ncbi:MAG: phospholipase D-like domain-containing protein [Bacteroidota bacterium]|nr:phospholipase D-like domain-containing protein [Bacteroidota bacterium]
MNLQFRKNRDIFPFIYSEVEKSKFSIRAALAWFTDPELLKLLHHKKVQDRIDVSIILFNDEINKMLGSYTLLGDNIRFSNVLKHPYIMHHKFCIIDNSKIITGSYNWTIKARRYNRENIIYIEDEKIVNEFNSEFDNLFKNSLPQSAVPILQKLNELSAVENVEIFNLEQDYNKEIERRIIEAEKLRIGIDINIAYSMIKKHTPVIAATKLTTAEAGQYIQSGLVKLEAAGRLDLCFEESIIRKEYASLFNEETKRLAKQKLIQLNFFKNPKYQHLWSNYI